MKLKSNDWDREKKIHKVQKGNKSLKHRKNVYHYEVEQADGYDEELEEQEEDIYQKHEN